MEWQFSRNLYFAFVFKLFPFAFTMLVEFTSDIYIYTRDAMGFIRYPINFGIIENTFEFIPAKEASF